MFVSQEAQNEEEEDEEGEEEEKTESLQWDNSGSEKQIHRKKKYNFSPKKTTKFLNQKQEQSQIVL